MPVWTSGMTAGRDTIFAGSESRIELFRFDERVAAVFPDMISRSVPGYAQTLAMIELIARQYAQTGSRLYDLGCSLGAATLAMQRGTKQRNCRIIAVDNSPAMLRKCRENIAVTSSAVDLVCADILETDIEDASLVVMNFVLQFVAREKRPALLEKICRGLRPGGVLILSEKVAFADDAENRRQIGLHEAFKRAQGYSQLEVSSKRTALENVLIPETLEVHHARLGQAGFDASLTWFQCFNFASMLAFKA